MINMDGTIQSSFTSFDLHEIAKWFLQSVFQRKKKKKIHEVKHLYELLG